MSSPHGTPPSSAASRLRPGFDARETTRMQHALVPHPFTSVADAAKSPGPACACPVAAFQKLISGKYKLRIVWDLKDGPLRYGEIRTGLLRGSDGSAEIAPRVLSRELKALAQ